MKDKRGYQSKGYSNSDHNNKVFFEKEWIEEGISQKGLENVNTWCENDLAKSEVTTSKLRKFYGEVKRIQSIGVDSEKGRRAFMMLKPKLAYAVGRESKNYKFKQLYHFLEKGINHIAIDQADGDQLKKRFNNFTHVFEAIVAYHKFHGGKD